MDTQFRRNFKNKQPTLPLFGIVLLLMIIGFSLAIIFIPQWSNREVINSYFSKKRKEKILFIIEKQLVKVDK